MSSIQDITAEYTRIEAGKHQIGGLAFFSRDHKKTREWQVLGAVQQLLLRANLDAPIFAAEHETPDFHTYLHDGRSWAPVEIVEVLRPDYRRHDFYRQDALPSAPMFHEVPPPLERPWEPLRDQIHSKARKGYPKDTCLIAYHDIGRMSFRDWTTPFHEQLLSEHVQAPFAGLDAFHRVLILSSDMQCLVQLYPDALTITPDHNT